MHSERQRCLELLKKDSTTLSEQEIDFLNLPALSDNLERLLEEILN